MATATTTNKRISHHHHHHHPSNAMMVAAVLIVLSSMLIINVAVSGEILQLTTAENFHETVAGKSVFISFVSSSSCGEACDAMQETWSRLSDDWKGHAVGLVAQVDCSIVDHDDENEDHLYAEDIINPICEEYGIVDTFPTVIYGDPASPELYPHGDIDDLTNYEALSAFCQATISQPTCSFERLSYCSEPQRIILQDLLSKTRDELDAMELKVDEQLQEQQAIYDAGLQKINDDYQKLVDEYNSRIETIRQETHYKWLQQVLGDMDHKDAERLQAELEEGEDEEL